MPNLYILVQGCKLLRGGNKCTRFPVNYGKTVILVHRLKQVPVKPRIGKSSEIQLVGIIYIVSINPVKKCREIQSPVNGCQIKSTCVFRIGISNDGSVLFRIDNRTFTRQFSEFQGTRTKIAGTNQG